MKISISISGNNTVTIYSEATKKKFTLNIKENEALTGEKLLSLFELKSSQKYELVYLGDDKVREKELRWFDPIFSFFKDLIDDVNQYDPMDDYCKEII